MRAARVTLETVPELPDITVYIEGLEARILQRRLEQVRILNPFVLRTAVPPIHAINGRRVVALRRIGKRIALGFQNELWLVLHLMIAGRLHWRGTAQAVRAPGSTRATGASAAVRPRKLANQQAAFDFESGTLVLTEAGTKRRASLHLVQGETALRELDAGGLEVLGFSVEAFARALTTRNHTLKRALADPRLFSGIGNAYSDEILHRARLSPVALTQRLSQEQIQRLHTAVQETLTLWIERLRAEAGNGFPENVTAFRPEMAVHGKLGQPCPVCGAKVQRIRYAENETNYCPTCQTEGKLLADRSLSLLLKGDWPRTPEELEELRAGRRSFTS
jgi:formamidopyrimidine-DNA glycosylase